MPNRCTRLVLLAAALPILWAQTEPPAPPPDQQIKRILGVVPNYQTVSDPHQTVQPLTVKQKFELTAQQTFDPFVFGSALAGAALSQSNDGDPKYGEGSGPYAQRFGAAVADISTQNFFSGAVMASVLHEDPRYFRRGPEFGFWNRLGYSVSRVVITRTDAGHNRFNYSGILGMSMGIALSNAYYPDRSVNGEEVATRFGTSLVASAIANVLPEFWPDLRQKFFHRKPKS
ncbi:MAG: hypothetical protein LAP38_26450 [Acidobacteriia bacterium]|nr:hypothetical protein [Terriglobia bacterium]